MHDSTGTTCLTNCLPGNLLLFVSEFANVRSVMLINYHFEDSDLWFLILYYYESFRVRSRLVDNRCNNHADR